MKKEIYWDIFTLLLIPAFLLAGAVKPIFLGFSYVYFNEWNILLMVLILGTLAIFTYQSIADIFSNFQKIKPRLSKLISYILSLIILIVASIILYHYVWILNNLETNGRYTITQPVVLPTTSDVVIFTGDILINIVLGAVISLLVTYAIKKFYMKYKVSVKTQEKIEQNTASL